MLKLELPESGQHIIFTLPSLLLYHPKMPDLLPSEIWSQIFDLAADEDILFRPGIPTAMAESAWYKDIIINEWRLRSRGYGYSSAEELCYKEGVFPGMSRN